MSKTTLIPILPPGEGPPRLPEECLPARRLWRLGPEGALLRVEGPPPRGGLLAVDDEGHDGRGDAQRLCRTILGQCRTLDGRGAVLLFSSGGALIARLARALDEVFARQGLSLYVPERLGHCVKNARVMISSALSGGSLRARLEESARRFGGPEKLALLLEPMAELFLLPSPTGCGRTLERGALYDCLRRQGSAVFFSPSLCARYFTYMDGDGRGRFVLFDDGDTLRSKLELCAELGIPAALGRWEQIGEMV